jgi:diguanylate cyclase (GGDEF)-like protein
MKCSGAGHVLKTIDAMPAALPFAYIDAYLRQPTRWLRFEPRLERRFVVKRGRATRALFRLGLTIGVTMTNLGMASLLLAGLVASDLSVRYFLTIQVVDIPALITLLVAQRRPSSLARLDLLLSFIFGGIVAGHLLTNLCLSGEPAIYHLFMLSVVPVVFAVLVNPRFTLALPAALAATVMFSVCAAYRPDFPLSAKLFIPVTWLASSACALIANYRLEVFERKSFLVAFRDRLRASEAERANRRLDALARTDGLTGLANRREFDARFAAQTALARAEGKPLALIVLDIDHFKLYNDRLGHPQGDKCIRVVARAIAESIGPAPHFAGRIGGEEFAAVLPEASVETAAATAQAIRRTVEAMQLPHPALGERRVVSVSVGVACFTPARPESPEALLARADAALYRAKRAGRDRVEFDLRVVGA